jgi:hypothetical protein
MTVMTAMAMAVVIAVTVVVAPGTAGALAPQSPPASAVMTPTSGPTGTEVDLTISYDAGIAVWCTEEVDGAVTPEPGTDGWSVALLFTDAYGAEFAIPADWSRTAGRAALPMGPLPDGNSVTVTFTIPGSWASGTYTGVGGCVSPDGGQPGPGIADVVFEVVTPEPPHGPVDQAAPVHVATPRFSG